MVGSNQTNPKITADESRKTVTILECVSAAGATIGPLVIHEGAEKDAEWVHCATGPSFTAPELVNHHYYSAEAVDRKGVGGWCWNVTVL